MRMNTGNHTEVFLDTVTQTSKNDLQNILADSQFAAIENDNHRFSAVVEHADFLAVEVPRDHKLQQFSFFNPDGLKPYDKALKPLMDWLKVIQNQKLRAVKGEKPNGCAAPKPEYRDAGLP